MRTPYKIKAAWVLRLFLGMLALYAAYGVIAPQVRLARYKQLFGSVQHPRGTSKVDGLALQIEYYPATYADESIRFKSAYFVGELRRYSSDWKSILLFYDTPIQEEESTPVWINTLPVRFIDGQLSIDTESAFASGYGYALDPFTADLLSNIEDHYHSSGLPAIPSGTDQRLYLVYAIWHPAGP